MYCGPLGSGFTGGIPLRSLLPFHLSARHAETHLGEQNFKYRWLFFGVGDSHFRHRGTQFRPGRWHSLHRSPLHQWPSLHLSQIFLVWTFPGEGDTVSTVEPFVRRFRPRSRRLHAREHFILSVLACFRKRRRYKILLLCKRTQLDKPVGSTLPIVNHKLP